MLCTIFPLVTDEIRQSASEDNLYQMSTTTQPPSRESLEETHETAKSRNPPSWEKRAPSNKSVQNSYYSLKGAPLSNTPTVRNPTTSSVGPTPDTLQGGPYPYIVTRGNVAHFKGGVSACEPLGRNQEIESWIRAIENIVLPNDNGYVRLVRAHCRGRAGVEPNSSSTLQLMIITTG